MHYHLIDFSIYLYLFPALLPEFATSDFASLHYKVGPRLRSSKITEESADTKNYKNF